MFMKFEDDNYQPGLNLHLQLSLPIPIFLRRSKSEFPALNFFLTESCIETCFLFSYELFFWSVKACYVYPLLKDLLPVDGRRVDFTS